MKSLWAVFALGAMSVSAHADAGKPAPSPPKLGQDARVFVVDKAAPSLDKTQPLARTRAASKDK